MYAKVYGATIDGLDGVVVTLGEDEPRQLA